MKMVKILVALGTLAAEAAWACNSPLVLDLNGDGRVSTTNAWREPLLFDIDGDGHKEATAWPSPYTGEGLLVIDLNNNGLIDGGQELFGDATILPTGKAEHGFEALAAYDDPEMGGNGDGMIDHFDFVWHQLRIWVDESFDGTSQRTEIRPLSAWRIVGLSLQYDTVGGVDGNMNLHQYAGTYFKRIDGREGAFEIRPMLLEDVYFRVSEDP